ncbi:MAG: CPBP family intramembrane metalloprotease [Planctomycetes bacterium]|nr:CPBP family intramembrane metalloprotease [Planctomycetota bacterium]
MTIRRIKTVYVKELVDILRDHRTLIAMIVVPIVLYPLLMLGSIQAVSTQAEQAEQERPVVGFERERDWTDVVMPLLLEDRDHLEQMRRDAVARGATEEELAQIPKPLIDVEAKATAQLKDAILQREVQCGIIVEDDGRGDGSMTDQIFIRLLYQPDDLRSDIAAGRLQDAFERVARYRVDRRLARVQLERAMIEPIVVSEEHLITSGSVLGMILPFILILMTITGAIYPAIDLTAGERERGTLETLMVCPVPVVDLIVGKFLVVTTIAMMGATLNLASVTATVYFGGFTEALDIDTTDNGGGFPFGALPVILFSLVPFAILMSAIMIAVCGCARTFKEAQNYITPVILAVLVPAGIAALPGSRLEGVMMVMPVGNMVLLTRELLSGVTISASTFTWVLLSTSLYAAVAVALSVHLFGKESVVFADSLSLRALLNRRLIRPAHYPSLVSAALYVAILFPIWFYVQSSLQLGGDVDFGRVLRSTAVLMPIFFVALPLGMLIYWKIDIRTTFKLALPKGRYLLAAIIIGLTAWVPVHELFVFQEHYIASPPALSQMDQALGAALKAMPVALVFLVMAVVPALSEELLFRGFLLSGLGRSMRKWTAIVVVGCIFGVYHFFLFKFATTALLGIVLGWLCWQSRSIWPAVVAHALHNGLAVGFVIWPEWQTQIGITGDDPWAHLPVTVIVPACGLFVAGLLLSRSAAYNEPETPAGYT